MRALRQPINGTLWEYRGADGEPATALLLDPAADPLYLRYALVIMGPEDHILPAFLLDDWGNEIKGVRLYTWLREQGNAFPRAEIFGFATDGREVQHFVRELELYVRWPCYAYAERQTPLSDGRRVLRVLLADEAAAAPAEIACPADVKLPLRRADVTWWLAAPGQLAAHGYRPVTSA